MNALSCLLGVPSKNFGRGVAGEFLSPFILWFRVGGSLLTSSPGEVAHRVCFLAALPRLLVLYSAQALGPLYTTNDFGVTWLGKYSEYNIHD